MKFEIKKKDNKNVIFIEDILFDWEFELKDLEEAVMFAGNDECIKKAIHGDIKSYLLESLSEFLQKEVTISDIINAIKTGKI